ncbi:MAG TPA: hypothetical protein VG186_16705 [Solirubrobacteraceae bacterium]|nr:hypothetical protein [Solirubrobacteraceae bacterium]
MIHRALVLVALACSGFVAASFVMFARDQIAGASKQQAAAVYSTPAGQVVPVKPKQEGQPGRFINGAARDLTSPFRSIVQSGSAWVQRGVPTVLALLVYGVGLGYLARFTRGFA